MYNIDDYDLKILTLLQANGRLTNQELSELIGLSASSVRAAVSPLNRHSLSSATMRVWRRMQPGRRCLA